VGASARLPGRGALTTYVAFLRGINVGGNNMIKMSALRDSFEQLGFKDVATYINSGNVLFKTRESDARKIEKKIERMLADDYKLPCKVVIRSAEEMANLVKKLPKDWTGDKEWRYNVIFLRHTIDSKDIVADLKFKADLEKVTYVPGTLLWSAHVNDVPRTTMLKLSSHKMFHDMTVRNLNTTRKLHELLQKMSAD
jgi:uncharacterized protein (DUF1697 family)